MRRCRALLCLASASALQLARRELGLAVGVAASSIGRPAAVAAAAAAPRTIKQRVELEIDGAVQGATVERLTGEGTGLQFPVRDLALFEGAGFEWDAAWPYTADDMRRIDENDDTQFYDFPKLVYHIDEGAVAALTQFYARTIAPGSAILDICSSWVSHYPLDFPARMSRISATGISALELKANAQLTDFVARDLNREPKLPFESASFDVVTCVVSVDYLNKPREVMKEIARVLKPGGRVIFSQSNRLFYTKAVKMWLSMDDLGRLEVIGNYIHFADAFEAPRALDISAKGRGAKDPMYIVDAVRRRA